MSTGNDNKSSPQNQGVKSPPIDAQTISHPFHTYTSFPTHFTPRTYEGKLYFAASDIAKIVGVTKRTVLWWNQKELFTADIRTHDGIYLYEVERVLQLRDVYRSNWMRGGYEPSPTTNEPEKPPETLGNKKRLPTHCQLIANPLPRSSSKKFLPKPLRQSTAFLLMNSKHTG